ncbi:MAG: helix-turn-helix domain-containing protein [bacterium]
MKALGKALDIGKCGEGPCPTGTRVPLAVRQRVFASLLGTTRESLNKLLHAWEKDGLVSRCRSDRFAAGNGRRIAPLVLLPTMPHTTSECAI